MAEYRLFFLGSDGAVEARQDFVAGDDETALQIMAVIAHASVDSHHGVMLWQGTRRILELDDKSKGDGAGLAALRDAGQRPFALGAQQIALDCEEALLSSHWRLAKSRSLLEATAHLRRKLGEPPVTGS